MLRDLIGIAVCILVTLTICVGGSFLVVTALRFVLGLT